MYRAYLLPNLSHFPFFGQFFVLRHFGQLQVWYKRDDVVLYVCMCETIGFLEEGRVNQQFGVV